MTIAVGDKLPEAELFEMTAEGPGKVSLGSLTAGKTVAMFGVPGAYTPTCHLKHMPSFVDQAGALKAKGVDAILCVTVNDPFVVGEWAKATGAADAGIRVLGDSDAALVKAMGLDFDGSVVGLGARSQRFSALVRDGEIAILAVEDAPSKAEATTAEALLAAM